MDLQNIKNALLDLKLGLDASLFQGKVVSVRERSLDVPHAPNRIIAALTAEQRRQCIANALRYIPKPHHDLMAEEAALELELYGHIYFYRLRPTTYEMKAYPINAYPAKHPQSLFRAALYVVEMGVAAAIMLMIMNNLDKRVAQFPHELITYGGNGSVFSNWAQYRLVMKYFSEMNDQQTLVMYSGHPVGLFPSSTDAPRVVVTNGMVIPNYSTRADYDRLYAMGNSQYGQMTAGSYCYIGPQGIVHGTTITVMNAARKFLACQTAEDMKGKVFVSAGLGGMSGAQPKAAVIAGMIAVIAEIDPSALEKRFQQGWIQEKETDIETVIRKIKEYKKSKRTVSIGWLGNVVALWERLAEEPEHLVDLGSDQTSLHNPFQGGYYPVTLSFEAARKAMTADPVTFKQEIYKTLRRHVTAVNKLAAKGMKFWDYGNAFLLEASRAGADVWNANQSGFRYASYFEDFMGVCTSGSHADLKKTDEIAGKIIKQLMAVQGLDKRVQQQYSDNLNWILSVEKHQLVVGSEARILYSNAEGRVALAEAFNDAIAKKEISGPVMLSRDHHDVSGTDSLFRETADVRDGSKYCADMSVQNALGNAFRGATSVSLHNGGGTGWGEAMNGGFLLLLDGTTDAKRRAKSMLSWDVNNGVSRRAWSGNANAYFQIQEAMKHDSLLKVTLPVHADQNLLSKLIPAEGKSASPKTKSPSNPEPQSPIRKRKADPFPDSPSKVPHNHD